MSRTNILAWVAALGLTFLGGQESWAQKGHIPAGGHSTPYIAPHVGGGVRPSLAPAYMHPVLNPRLTLPSSALHYQAPVWHGSWQSALALHGGAGLAWGPWNSWAWHRRRAVPFHNHFLTSCLFFNPWLGGYCNWSPLYRNYFYYFYGYNVPPYYDYYNPVTVPYNYNNYYFYDTTRVLPPTPKLDLTAHIEVAVPDANAAVWFGDYQTSSRGLTRNFTSPALEPGTSYSYTIKASWDESGQTRTAERVVYVKAGARVVVDFTQPPPK
jgi:uncharacterized protein (TIGR03000 family)